MTALLHDVHQMIRARARVDELIHRGFDKSHIDDDTFAVRVKCSQCEVLGICGVPCHETGCPNAMHECRGCNDLIPQRQRYCENWQ